MSLTLEDLRITDALDRKADLRPEFIKDDPYCIAGRGVQESMFNILPPLDRAKLAAALRRLVYETTHLSPREDDGSHKCRISASALSEARAALSEPPK